METQIIKQYSEALVAVRVVEVSFQDNVKHNKRKRWVQFITKKRKQVERCLRFHSVCMMSDEHFKRKFQNNKALNSHKRLDSIWKMYA